MLQNLLFLRIEYYRNHNALRGRGAVAKGITQL